MLRSLLALAICGPFLVVARADDRPAEGPGTTKLDGAWRMVAYRTAGGDEPTPLPKGWEQTKLIAGGRFVWTTVRDGRITRAAGGKATVRDDEYTEQIEFVLSEQDRWMAGKTGTFHWRLERGRLYVEGGIKTDTAESRISEVWERIE
ncbi:MAG TPA: hypothetical protein VF590_10185 [Isosphaeraceae bacterium]|jgi:hypothetical protein